MKQIRARIKEKRGVDYTEEQIRELATVRLEKFLDPKNLRSDLLEQFRRSRPAVPSEPSAVEPPFEFNDQTLFETHRGALRFIRRLLNPILKLFFNPNPLINVLHTQAQFNVDLLKREQRRKIEFDRSRAEWNALYYEVLHNLVLETTRSGIEIKNLKMRVEALISRLDFSERRVRALEGVVQYRPEAVRRVDRAEREQRAPLAEGAATGEIAAALPDGDAGVAVPGQISEGAKRRRRRRRGRRGSAGSGTGVGAPPPGEQQAEGDGQSPDVEDDHFEGAGDASDDVGAPSEADTGFVTPATEPEATAVEQGSEPDEDRRVSNPHVDPDTDDHQ
jgi:hypothetical protein